MLKEVVDGRMQRRNERMRNKGRIKEKAIL
jgi:hypothetical protein